MAFFRVYYKIHFFKYNKDLLNVLPVQFLIFQIT